MLATLGHDTEKPSYFFGDIAVLILLLLMFPLFLSSLFFSDIGAVLLPVSTATRTVYSRHLRFLAQTRSSTFLFVC